MLLIADSGSTKCDWLLVEKGKEILACSTMGFNPYFHDESIISNAIRNQESLIGYAKQVTSLYFYGAGCSSKDLRAIVQRALGYVFTEASEIHVGHDLDGAALATYEGEPLIACILGTGSNSCYFDGKKVKEEVPALGYILGDEGSGSYYGKQLLAKYLYNQLPQHIHDDFNSEFGLSKDEIMTKVYMRPHANVFLASFMKFLSRYKKEDFVREMVYSGMKHFLQTHVACFEGYKSVPVHFVGSVAFHFEGLLRQAGEELGIKIGNVIKKPIEGLLNYHLKYTFQEI